MKIYPVFLFLLLYNTSVFAQTVFPDFLQGTWQMDDKEIYEHWNILNENSMKGVSYAVDKEQFVIFEYLDLVRSNDAVIYTAFAVGANDGRGIPFTMTRSDSIFIFVNYQHDFPKIIVYNKLSDNEIAVTISDEGDNELSWILRKISH